MKELKSIHFDFNKPDEARKFLRGLYLVETGNKITGFQAGTEEWKEFSNLSDEEAMDRASEIYEWGAINKTIEWKDDLQ